MNDAHLKCKIIARNRVNQAILDIAPVMRGALAPFVGQKICKVDGSLLQKVRNALPEPPNTVSVFAYYTTGNGYTLRAGFRASQSVPGEGTQYAEADAYLGDIQDGVLIKIYPSASYRTDYELAEVKSLQEQLKAAQRTVSTVQSQLSAII